jgi:hypothetical protein
VLHDMHDLVLLRHVGAHDQRQLFFTRDVEEGSMPLTTEGSQRIADLAHHHGVSVEAVMTLLQALVHGGGTMAQFSHPEFGGSGQWMQGGMTMVGDMFNYALQAKVAHLCDALAGVLATPALFTLPTPHQPPSQGGREAVSLYVDHPGGSWWPAELGVPSSTGAQNQLRYAIFPATRRLAIDLNGQVTVYDTLEHHISGVGQQQGAGASFTFTSQYGLVPVTNLPIVRDSTLPPVAAPPAATAPVSDTGHAAEGDVFATLERLAALHQKGIVSDAEFTSKKAELLRRI